MPTRNTSLVFVPVRHRILPLYATEAVNSIASTLLTVGLPFYTSHRFGWGAKENFAIAALQGVLYMLGALSAQKISNRWGRERSLLGLYAGMTVFAIAVGISAAMFWPAATVLLVAMETGLMAASWPMLESLVSAGGDLLHLSKRLGCYNIVWASTGAAAVAACGTIIQNAPTWGFFGIVAAGHCLAGVLIFRRIGFKAARFDAIAPNPETEQPCPQREEIDENAACRHRLALWLSRIALPSTYVIVYSLAPALPSLHAIRQLSPAMATVVASIWLAARAVAFAVTGNTTFWHRRPGLMLLASVTMLFAFIAIFAAGNMAGVAPGNALAALAIAQTVLGFSIGTIYSASLYFGMAVSDGSTEHGGYHEALIGLGQVLGPLVGATMQWIHPDALWPAVMGISGVVSITVVVQAIVRVRITGGFGNPASP